MLLQASLSRLKPSLGALKPALSKQRKFREQISPVGFNFFHSSNLAGLVIPSLARRLFAPYIGFQPNATEGHHEYCRILFEQLDARIGKYDLLCHPFYKAWSAGELTRDDLREYAQDYYHQVEAFPSYLAALGLRLEEGELRRAVLANMCDEKGVEGGRGGIRCRTPSFGSISRKAWDRAATWSGTARCPRFGS
jgi:hypothetical protein